MTYGEKDYSDFGGQYFVFVGQNATTGEPHPITGNMSFWGRYYGPYPSRKAAQAFAERHSDYGYSRHIHEVGTARTLRQYSLGCSVQNYLQDLNNCEVY